MDKTKEKKTKNEGNENEAGCGPGETKICTTQKRKQSFNFVLIYNPNINQKCCTQAQAVLWC